MIYMLSRRDGLKKDLKVFDEKYKNGFDLSQDTSSIHTMHRLIIKK